MLICCWSLFLLFHFVIVRVFCHCSYMSCLSKMYIYICVFFCVFFCGGGGAFFYDFFASIYLLCLLGFVVNIKKKHHKCSLTTLTAYFV